jgi:hypothetical protein
MIAIWSRYDEIRKLQESFCLAFGSFASSSTLEHHHHTNRAQSRASALSTLHLFLHRFVKVADFLARQL